MSKHDNNPDRAQRVKLVEPLKDYKAYIASVNATQTLETALGEALQTTVAAVTIQNNSDTTLRYNPNGEAAASSFPIPAGEAYTVYGDKTILDLVQLYTGAADKEIGFIQHITQ